MEGVIRVRGVEVRYQGAAAPVLRGVDFDLGRGEFVALVGQSGVGKSTLLRAIAGLARPAAGTIERPVARDPARRAMALVFQDARLLPWRRVLNNVAFGLEGLALSAADRRARALAALTLVGLAPLADRWPHQLSGGQRQRVALARALAVEPDVLLMDEPFAALDAISRAGLQDELLRIRGATAASVLFVTHDIEEAVLLADRVILLGGQPATVQATYPVTAPHPRRRDDQGQGALVRDIRAGLSELVAEGSGI